MISKIHFSSQRLNWKTPKALYELLDKEFKFTHDPCPPNHKVDGLTSEWGAVNFCNPPYGREIGKWLLKGYLEWYENNKIVVFLIPSRTDTKWWHDIVMKATDIRFIKGRLKFDEYKNSAPFPSAVVIFK
jgi:hypothetical protein